MALPTSPEKKPRGTKSYWNPPEKEGVPFKGPKQPRRSSLDDLEERLKKKKAGYVERLPGDRPPTPDGPRTDVLNQEGTVIRQPPAKEIVAFEIANRLNHALYDFSPFFSALACQERTKRSSFSPVRIRNKLEIPSPLAENIRPESLPTIKRLCETFGRSYNGSNQEVWLSWKRAYDIWNNHFIEGRVNGEWVQGALKKLEERRKNRKRKRKTFTSNEQKQQPWKVYEEIYCLEEELPQREKQLKWVPSGQDPEEGLVQVGTETRKTGKKTKQKTKAIGAPDDKMVTKQPRKFAVDRTKFGKKEPELPLPEEPIRGWGDVVNGTALPSPEPDDYRKEKPAKRKKIQESVDKPAMKAVRVKVPVVDAQKVVGYGTLRKRREKGEPPEEESSEDESPASSFKTKTIYVPEYEEVEVEEEVVPTYRPALFPHWQLVDDPAYWASQKRRKITREGQYSVEDDETRTELEQGEGDDGDLAVIMNDDDGGSGGFKSMTLAAIGNIRDRVNNTVWRPRRVGEEPTEINLTDAERARAESEERNDDDFARFRQLTEFEIDGGVDCATQPFPTLRWAHCYLRNPQGLFRKRKIWDRVTGTIFNVPTTPLVKKLEPDREKRMPQPENHRDSIFPLDIRRVQAVMHEKKISLNQRGEKEVELQGLDTLQTYREMREDDPWWVTPEQEKRRDLPPRRWPIAKGHDEEDVLLPYDELDWYDHIDRDEKREYLYFATNLQGGTLLVNGAEVGKGEIVGPLPQFAIIECPGGQVAFWHGLKGWEFGDETPLNATQKSMQWEKLRQEPYWKDAGKSAGEVWARRMIDRLDREEAGEEGEPDDDIWKAMREWKKPDPNVPELAFQTVGRLGANLDYAVTNDLMEPRPPPPGEQTEGAGLSLVPGRDSPNSDNDIVRVPLAFSSPEEELKHLAIINEEFQKRATAINNNPVIQPQGDKFWEGKEHVRDHPAFGIVQSAVINEEWDKNKKEIIEKQKEYVKRFAKMPKRGQRKNSDGDFIGTVPSPKKLEWWEGVLNDTPVPPSGVSQGRSERERLVGQYNFAIECAKNPNSSPEDIATRILQKEKREAKEREAKVQKENRKRKANNLPEIVPPKRTKALQQLEQLEEMQEDLVTKFENSRIQKEAAKNLQDMSRSPTLTPPLPVLPISSKKEPLSTPESPPKQPPSPKQPPPKQPPPKQLPPPKQPPPPKQSPPPKRGPPKRGPPKRGPPKQPPPKRAQPKRAPPKPVYRHYPPDITGVKLAKFRLWDANWTGTALTDTLIYDIQATDYLAYWYIEWQNFLVQETHEVSSKKIRQEMIERVKAQAASFNMDKEEYAKSNNHKSFKAMVQYMIDLQKDDTNVNKTHTYPGHQDYSGYDGDRETAEQRNADMRFHAGRAIEEGLRAKAWQQDIELDDYLQQTGFDSLEDYKNSVLQELKIYKEVIPKPDKETEPGLYDVWERENKEEKTKFLDNMQRSEDWQEFEAQTRYFEENGLPLAKQTNDGKRYAVI